MMTVDVSDFQHQLMPLDTPCVTEIEAHQLAWDYLEHGARSVQTIFDDADDDWLPIWVLVQRDHVLAVASTVDKYAQVAYVAALVRIAFQTKQVPDVLAVGALVSSWLTRVEDVGRERIDQLMQAGSLPGAEERREILLMTSTGAARTWAFSADIGRDGVRPPTLGQFEALPNAGQELAGAMVDPIVKAFRRVEL